MTRLIEDGSFSAAIAHTGAELCSLLNRDTGNEYIWQADENVWAGSAPVLFPIVGRLRENTYSYNGQRYQMPGHGVVRRRDFTSERLADNAVRMTFRSDDQSRRAYPFPFELSVTFRLAENRLTVAYEVINEGDIEMPFTIGSHPALALGRDDTGVQDYFLRFSRPETLALHRLEGSLLDPQYQENYMLKQTELSLTESSFDDDALIFKNIASSQVQLVHREKGVRATLETGGAPHLGIWSKPAGRFVCIEPWFGFSDDVAASGNILEKPAMMRLAPGARFSTNYAIVAH